MSGVARLDSRQRVGGTVPDLELPAVAGGARTLGSFLDGRRGAVVLFWSSVCSHCIRYDEVLGEWEPRHPEIALVAVAARESETLEQVRQAAAERGLRFPILHSADGGAAAAFQAQQTPRAYLVDGARTLLYRGAIDNFKYPHDPEYRAYLEPAAAAFLAGRPIELPETPSFGCAIRSVYYELPKPLS
jgi:thiol-disulfide isomerase/thioredoxin